MPTNSNDANRGSRMKFAHELFEHTLQFKPRLIEPIAYEEDFPFPYNNFVYAVELDAQSITQAQQRQQPGTHPIPAGVDKFVLRLSNPLAELHHKNRVENEVAALNLAYQALEHQLPRLIPRVFGWGGTANDQQGWILQEYMPGSLLTDQFLEMSHEDQQSILEQLADVLQCFQRYQLPSSIDMYGTLTINQAGEIVSTSPDGSKPGPPGPFRTYAEFVLADIYENLAKVDSHPRLRGWKDNGLRVRLDKFLSTATTSLVRNVANQKKVLTHRDFTTENLLYDPATKRVTAVLDFDFAIIGTVADDFICSLDRETGRFPGPYDDAEKLQLRKAMLQGFPDPMPADTEDVKWSAARAWDDALRQRSMYRPSTIQGIEELSALFWLSDQLFPFKVVNEVVVGNSSEEQLARRMAEAAALLDNFLKGHGF